MLTQIALAALATATLQGSVVDDKAITREQWHIAAAKYQKLVDEGYDHPDLFLNLGNAHLLAGELPQAILAYHRGLHEHPLHGPLCENLEAARDQVAYGDDAWRHRPDGYDWPPWLPRPSPTLLLHTALALYGLAWFGVTAWLVFRSRWAAIIALLLFFASAIPAVWWGYLDYRIAQDDEHPLVVVAVNGVTLRRGNSPLYPQHQRLP